MATRNVVLTPGIGGTYGGLVLGKMEAVMDEIVCSVSMVARRSQSADWGLNNSTVLMSLNPRTGNVVVSFVGERGWGIRTRECTVSVVRLPIELRISLETRITLTPSMNLAVSRVA